MKIILFKNGDKIKISEENASIIVSEIDKVKSNKVGICINKYAVNNKEIIDKNGNKVIDILINVAEIVAIYETKNII